MIISDATAMNWERLHSDTSQKLRRGANKTRSVRRIYPKEYITGRDTVPFLEKVLAVCAEDGVDTKTAVYSLAMNLLKQRGISESAHVRETLRCYDLAVDEKLFSLPLPSGERDILGAVYQYLLPEGEKNTLGSYYTPFPVVEKMLETAAPGNGTFLDPCCGSGAFLLALPETDPDRLWGCDCDPVAVMIARVNLLCRYAGSVFIPHIFRCDYLKGCASPSPGNELFRKKFDCIATNPPWGAKGDRDGGDLSDSFSLFFAKACLQLADGGKISFLFPEAVLNIRSHAKIREMLLTELRLDSIHLFDENFTGVMTKYVAVNARKAPPAQTFLIGDGKTTLKKNVSAVLARQDRIITFSGDEDDNTLAAIAAAKKYDLSDGIFALGIVTGGNREKVKRTPGPGMEPIYTGREVGRYRLKKPAGYIFYDRSSFQQVAKDEYYRAPEKLVYKFISKEMVFSYDDTKSLFLNSANILIPRIPGYGMKTVLAFLNSEVLRYCYMKSFRDIKILKNNLCGLPFPEIGPRVREQIDRIVDRLLLGDGSEEDHLQRIIFDCYGLSEKHIAHIRKSLPEKPRRTSNSRVKTSPETGERKDRTKRYG